MYLERFTFKIKNLVVLRNFLPEISQLSSGKIVALGEMRYM